MIPYHPYLAGLPTHVISVCGLTGSKLLSFITIERGTTSGRPSVSVDPIYTREKQQLCFL